MEKKCKTALHISFIFLTVAIGIILGIRQIKPPQADESSVVYRRMMVNIQSLAAKPHPAGSAEIETVRAKLLAEIEQMDLSPVVEEAVSIPKSGGLLLLKNILVRLDSPKTDRGVLFMSHYDSTEGGPGAADDMVSVCALLEAMRAYAQNSELKNDFYFLFTDGEEKGMLGAWRFVAAHPELKDKIDMVINMEARGNRGGLLLFETSPEACSEMNVVVKSGAKPIGFSWAAAVYAMMPNYTDFTAFLDSGYRGINFAMVEGVENYHRMTDNFEHLNRSSAGQYLQTALALADYVANEPLNELREPPAEAVYFPFLPGFMVLMSGLISYILCGLICALAVGWGIVQIKNKRLKISFSMILLGLLLLLSIGSALFFASGSYLFYIPLLLMTLTKFLRKWKIAHIAAQMASGVIVLLLWTPAVFLLWITLIQPKIL